MWTPRGSKEYNSIGCAWTSSKKDENCGVDNSLRGFSTKSSWVHFVAKPIFEGWLKPLGHALAIPWENF